MQVTLFYNKIDLTYSGGSWVKKTMLKLVVILDLFRTEKLSLYKAI
jgi:hypothetical protein